MDSDRRDVLGGMFKQAAREPYEGCAMLQKEVSSDQYGGEEKEYLEAGKKAVCACGGEDGRPLPDISKLTHAQQAEVATSHRYPVALTKQAGRALLDWVSVATDREELRSIRSIWKAHNEPCRVSVGHGYLSKSFFSDRLSFQWQSTEDNLNKRLSALDEQELRALGRTSRSGAAT
jgi:hypothetical protein